MSGKWPPIPPIWRGETAFVIGGGSSFGEVDPERLRGRRVVVVNSSWEKLPWADVLFFGDDRWWRHWKKKVVAGFPGHIITTATTAGELRVVKLRNSAARRGLVRKPPLIWSTEACSVPMRRTSLLPAMNIAAHLLGMEGRIVLMGADGRAHGGKSHHHAPHPWPVRPGCWDVQRRDFDEVLPLIKKHPLEVLNASPGSAWADIWPVVSPDEVL